MSSPQMKAKAQMKEKTKEKTKEKKDLIVRERRGTEVIESCLRAHEVSGEEDVENVLTLSSLREKETQQRLGLLGRLGIGGGGLGFGGAGLVGRRQEVRERLTRFLMETFLPAGYPESVSSDYLRYQILNALQAFCSSLASLLSSRAVLQGFGVGNASASANDALLLTIAQDIFGRVTTIVAASKTGSSLYPEAKHYRFLADILMDTALLLDTLSPSLAFISFPSPISFPSFFQSLQWAPPSFIPAISFNFLHSIPPVLRIPTPTMEIGQILRITALCLAACARSVCIIVAGGSKTALTVHFATPTPSATLRTSQPEFESITGEKEEETGGGKKEGGRKASLVGGKGKGDVGDLNAKDASKETVLGLLGMLLGTLLVPRLTSSTSTWIALLLLFVTHLWINYLAVKGIILTKVNRQRVSIAWMVYESEREGHSPTSPSTSPPSTSSSTSRLTPSSRNPLHTSPSPKTIASYERILDKPGWVRDALGVGSGERIGEVFIGGSFAQFKLKLERNRGNDKRKGNEKKGRRMSGGMGMEVWDIFTQDRFVVWPEVDLDLERWGWSWWRKQRRTAKANSKVHVFLKEGYTSLDLIRGWITAVRFLSTYHRRHRLSTSRSTSSSDQTSPPSTTLTQLKDARSYVHASLPAFLRRMHDLGWEVPLDSSSPSPSSYLDLDSDSEAKEGGSKEGSKEGYSKEGSPKRPEEVEVEVQLLTNVPCVIVSVFDEDKEE